MGPRHSGGLQTVRAVVKGAAKRMKDDQISSLLVKKGGKIVGIITDSDIVRRGVAGTKDLTKLTVQDIMTAPAVTARAETPAADVVAAMASTGLHHLPVVDADNRLVGVVSQTDLVAALLADGHKAAAA